MYIIPNSIVPTAPVPVPVTSICLSSFLFLYHFLHLPLFLPIPVSILVSAPPYLSLYQLNKKTKKKKKICFKDWKFPAKNLLASDLMSSCGLHDLTNPLDFHLRMGEPALELQLDHPNNKLIPRLQECDLRYRSFG